VIINGPLCYVLLRESSLPFLPSCCPGPVVYGYPLHILLHSLRSDSTCTVYEMSGDVFGSGDGLHNY